MQLIFLAHNCNITFVKTEISMLLENPEISELHVFTEKTNALDGMLANDKFYPHFYTNSSAGLSIFTQVKLYFSELFHNREYYKSWSRIRAGFSEMRSELRKTSFIFQSGIPSNAVFYSFWGSNEAFILSILKKYKNISNFACTRVHSYDVYEELDGNNGIPWRWLMNKTVDFIFPISENGREYLIKKYPEISGKVKTFYLGIPLKEPLRINEAPLKEVAVVSCGWVYRHKNFDAVFQSLNRIPNLVWTHIGIGDDFDRLSNSVKNEANIHVNLMGSKTQREIQDIYAQSKFTCFISLSTTEGLPVSMMEAVAFGIPIVSSDVGGCAEIVNENTGVLLSKNYDDEEVRLAVEQCAVKFSSVESRRAIQEECKRKFDAEKNAKNFIQFLKEQSQIIRGSL